jgi:hypothetical protein
MKILSIGHLRVLSLTGIAATALAFLLVGSAAPASAQSVAKVNIDFPFVAGTSQLAAGAYEFEVNNGKVTVRSTQPKGTSVVMLGITRLGRHDLDKETELIFDKVNNKFVLSEIWLGNEDGYLVTNTPGDHEHRVLGGSKPHK